MLSDVFKGASAGEMEATPSSYNSCVEEFRDSEYPMLKDAVYLDHAGTTLCSKSLMDKFSADLMSSLLGNPHSGSSPSQYTTSRIEDIRLRLLRFFKADPSEFDIIFVANATAGVKLVTEAFRAMPDGFRYAYHQACHTSLVGVREEAKESVCVDSDTVHEWVAGRGPFENGISGDNAVLFSYPLQSHMDGRRYPLSWSEDLRKQTPSSSELYTLLDAASLVATSPLDLSDAESAPDFTVMSLYKIFGFPDLGALIVRRQAEHVFRFRKYFGGGTVDMVVSGKEQWHASKTQFLHERLEDGTLPFHSIIALDAALDTHRELFGSMAKVASHTAFLSRRLLDGLTGLRHGNGQSVCVLYSQQDKDSGPVVAFNIRNATGAWVSLTEFEKLSTLKDFHVRTGGVCSPGGIAAALQLQPWEIRRNFSAGFKCGADQDIIAGKPTGVIRASLGAMSTKSDVDKFISFIEEFYREEHIPHPAQAPTFTSTPKFRVESITVYPIKSCAGFIVPPDTPWEVKPEGLAWDREWCLVHQGTGQALSQKRFPQMALLRPSLDFNQGVLRVTYAGATPPAVPQSIAIPLSAPPSASSTRPTLPSRVCGDQITALTYTTPSISDFFSAVLGVPCLLARFPPGGHGPNVRHSKPHTLKHLHPSRPTFLPGSFPNPPSPPDSDSEQQQQSKILLSNESPILLISSASLEALNRDVTVQGGDAVSAAAFRGNIVVGPVPKSPQEDAAYAEDAWTSLRIGNQPFSLMGSCRRCQMVCIDQTSGVRRQEPFVTLAKTRRFDGKVYFGMHMRHDPPGTMRTKEEQFPTIRVGDVVRTDESSPEQ